MGLKFVTPNIEKTSDSLGFAGEDKTEQRRISRRMAVFSRGSNLYSDVQRAGDIVVTLPVEVGEKHSDFEERVKFINPRITTEGYKIGIRGFINCTLHVGDMIRVQGKGGYQTMRLASGIVINREITLGTLKLSVLRQEVHIQNKDGIVSEEIKERTYGLKSRGQGRMIQVPVPVSVPLKKLNYNVEVEIIRPVTDIVTTTTFQGANVDWYIKAGDIILKKGVVMNLQPPKKDHPAEK